MKHMKAHKLDFACLDCVKKHIEHKEKLIQFVKRVANTDLAYSDLDIEAEELLAEIKADEG